MSNDPLAMFKPASQIERKLKILVYGPWKTGKTIFALSFTKAGKVAVIDPEMSAGVYGNQYQFGHFPTKDLAEVMRAIAAIKADGGKTYQTLVIDPITILWSTLCDAGQLLAEKRAGKGTSANGTPVDVVMSRREWGIVKRLYNKLMNELVMLPVHVVITAREKDLLDESERKIGVRPDTEKNTAYAPDIILHFISENGVYKAKIEGYRKMFPEDTRKVGDIITNPSYETFADAVTSGTRIVIPDDDQAIQSAAALLEAEERQQAQPAPSEDSLWIKTWLADHHVNRETLARYLTDVRIDPRNAAEVRKALELPATACAVWALERGVALNNMLSFIDKEHLDGWPVLWAAIEKNEDDMLIALRDMAQPAQPSAGTEPMANEKQKTSIRLFYQRLNRNEPDPDTLTFKAARDLLKELSDAYGKARQEATA